MLFLLLSPLACSLSDDVRPSDTLQHPDGKGFFVVSEDCTSANPHDGSPSQPETSAAAACDLDGGTNCNATSFISAAAARCIAANAGLAEGLAPWDTSIVYNGEEDNVRWIVRNTTKDPGGYAGVEGDAMAVHATSGAVLGSFLWGAIP